MLVIRAQSWLEDHITIFKLLKTVKVAPHILGSITIALTFKMRHRELCKCVDRLLKRLFIQDEFLL